MDKEPVTLIEWLGLPDWPNMAKGRVWGVVLGMALVALFLVALIAMVVVIFGTIHDVLGGLGAGPNLGAGGLIAALLGAPFLIWSTVIKHRALGFQKEGHLTDRISAAVEQLGAEKTVKKDDKETTVPNIEVRIGGILSLERIAQDSTAYDKGRDHVRVMEILCAYIRHNAPASEAKDHDFGEWVPLKDDASGAERAAHLERRKLRFGERIVDSQVHKWAESLPEPRADITIALRVIGRRTPAQRRAEARWGKDAGPNDEWIFDQPCPQLANYSSFEEIQDFKQKLQAWHNEIVSYKGYCLDLRETNLQGAEWSTDVMILSGARLIAARMEGANLRGVRMEGADLRLARIDGSYLSDASLEGAKLQHATLESAILQHVKLNGADLMEARMERANLFGAKMQGTNLWQTKMELGNLERANLVESNLSLARMEGADLESALLDGAHLYKTWLNGANLRWVRMRWAMLNNTMLDANTNLIAAELSRTATSNMNFLDVPISSEQIESMFGDASVILPNAVTPTHPDWPEHWPKIKVSEFFNEWLKWLSNPNSYTPIVRNPLPPDLMKHR